MSVTLSAFGGVGAQFFDSNGNPLTGGKIFTYLAGTTTPYATYTTNIGNVARTNPIILDAAGRVPGGGEIWVTTGVGYKFVLTNSADVLIATYDNVPSSAPPVVAADADNVQYEQGYTVTAGSFVVGKTYQILTLGNTNFMLIGATSNTVGAYFVATGVGAGTGTARLSQTVAAKLQQTVSVKDYGAVGNGVVDDTFAIQTAINSNQNGAIVYFPSGNYRITSALQIPSNVTIRGNGRNFGTVITPVGCPAFDFDGSLYVGGYVFRDEISDILISCAGVVGTNIVRIRSAYNIKFSNVFIYDTPVSVTNCVYVSQANDVVFEDFIVYGTNTAGTFGFNIDGATVGPVRVKLIRPDIETCNRGVKATGNVVMDIVSPYMERCTVCYTHEITSGQVSIFGGLLASVNGYGVNIAGPNLTIVGTDIDPYTGSVPGGLGINAASSTAFQNVILDNIPKIANNSFINAATNNYLTTNFSRPPIANYWDRKFNHYKVLEDNIATDVFILKNFAQYCKCKLTLHGLLGAAYVISEFQWIITNPGSTTSNVATTTVLNQSNANWSVALSMALVPDAGNGFTTVSVTANTGGALGSGLDFPLYAELEIIATESGVANVVPA